MNWGDVDLGVCFSVVWVGKNAFKADAQLPEAVRTDISQIVGQYVQLVLSGDCSGGRYK